MIFKFANHRTKESFVTATNKPLVGTLTTIGDVTVSIAIAKCAQLNDATFSTFISERKGLSFNEMRLMEMFDRTFSRGSV